MSHEEPCLLSGLVSVEAIFEENEPYSKFGYQHIHILLPLQRGAGAALEEGKRDRQDPEPNRYDPEPSRHDPEPSRTQETSPAEAPASTCSVASAKQSTLHPLHPRDCKEPRASPHRSPGTRTARPEEQGSAHGMAERTQQKPCLRRDGKQDGASPLLGAAEGAGTRSHPTDNLSM